MTVQELYKRFLVKINKNDTNSNINVPKGIFVLIFNEATKVWLASMLRDELADIRKNYISELLVHEAPFVKISEEAGHTAFALPDDWFNIETAYSICSKGDCSNRIVYNFDFKQRDKNVLFGNENYKPSFEYQETWYNVTGKQFIVYTDNFKIDQELVTYYRLPRPIDIEGYIRFDGTPSKNIDSDLDDRNILEILNLCSLEAVTNFENAEAFQLQKQRTIS